jgi:hypothetical protein
LVPTAESEAVAALTRKAAKAGLEPKLLKQIEQDARWTPTSKKALVIGGAQCGAKWANKAGLSAEYKPECILAMAVVRIAAGHFRLARQLDTLIAEQRERNKVPITKAPTTEAKP